MVQTHKKRSHAATANSPSVLPDMGKIYFINLVWQRIFSLADILGLQSYICLFLNG